jgi:hypothetical protein
MSLPMFHVHFNSRREANSDGLADYDIEFMTPSIDDHLQETGPLAGGAAYCSIAVSGQKSPSLRLDVPSADFDLVLDRLTALSLEYRA